MGYLFPYQVQQIKHYQERLIPVKKHYPASVDKTAKVNNSLQSDHQATQWKGASHDQAHSFQKIYADMTGVGKHVNDRI